MERSPFVVLLLHLQKEDKSEQMGKRLVSILMALVMMLTAGAQEEKPHPWWALGEVVVVNGIVYGLDRYILNQPFSKISWKTIKHNLRSSYAWDDDNFYVNQFGHAYQGSLYFNAARSNGLNFFQSVPYTLIGSVVWEYFCENEQPSINDVVTTVFTGSFMGETLHRVSRKIIDEHETGGCRFLREVTAAVLDPLEGFRRVVSGRAWKIGKDNSLRERTGEISDQSSLMVGDRYLTASENLAHGAHQAYVGLNLEYGQAADGESHSELYDFFSIDGALAIGKEQHLLSHLHLTGRLCSTPLLTKEKASGELGLYQFFNYEDSRLPGDTVPRGPFPYGEMVSFGPGVMFDFPQLAPHVKMEQRFHARCVALGAIESDYYKFYNRHYNMGSGYGASTLSKVTWENRGAMQLTAHYMHLYTWKGYEPKDLSGMVFDTNYLNVLGDRSDARLFTLNMQLHANISTQFGLTIGASYTSRHTHYKYHPDKHAESYELRAGMECLF